MKIVKIQVHVSDIKYGNSSYSRSAISVEAAVKFLEEKFKGLKDSTEEHYKKYPYGCAELQPIKVFYHNKPRFDSDGDWDYPEESTIELYWEEVIE